MVNARTRLALGTAVLLAVAGAVSGLAWFAVVKRGAERRAAEARTKQVLGVGAADVVALRVRAKGDDVRLERTGEAGPDRPRWRIVAPFQADADGAEVEALVARLVSLERRAQSAAAGESQERLRVYGLDAPSARFDLELTGGRTATLALGGDTGFDGAMFVMPASGEVLVVEGRARLELERTAFELRERRLLRFEPGAVAAIEVVAPRSAFTLAPGGGAWRLTAPVPGAADARRAEDLVAALRDVRATAFEDGAPPPGKPAYAIRVALAGGGELRLEAWRARDGGDAPLVVRASGQRQLARVPASALGLLDGPLDAWRAPPVPPAGPAPGSPPPTPASGG